MAKHPEPASRKNVLASVNPSTGAKLVGFGAAMFVLTRVVIWLPLGILGTWINGILWPVVILSVLAGAGLLYMKSKRPPQTGTGG